MTKPQLTSSTSTTSTLLGAAPLVVDKNPTRTKDEQQLHTDLSRQNKHHYNKLFDQPKNQPNHKHQNRPMHQPHHDSGQRYQAMTRKGR